MQAFSTVRTRYVLALLLVALLSVSAYTLLSRVIHAQTSSGAVINVSGRQRMLSQRTALFAQQLVVTQDPAARVVLRLKLSAAADLMEVSHLGLTAGDETLHLPGNPSRAVAEMYYEAPLDLDAQVREHLARVRRLLAAPDVVLTPENPDLQALLASAPGELLESLNAVVGQYELEANRQVAQLKRFEASVLVVTLLTLLLEGLFIFSPMEREIKRRSEQLLHDALHDALTGLPNRLLLTERLEQALARRARDPEEGFAALFLDLNRFKVINDSLGHTVGDELLVAFSRRLKTCVRGVDTVARLGGDEFVVLLEGVAALAEAEAVAGRINRALETPVDLGEHRLHVSTSIGVVLAGALHARPEDVLRDADIAMYRAKAGGKVGFEVFEDAMRERAASVMTLENDLRRAAAAGEFVLYYQPIVSVGTGRVDGFEALLRWLHPRLGLVAPGEFIPIAEDSGLIVDIDRWVLRAGLEQLRRWHRDLDATLTLSLNLSSQQFSEPDLVDFVETLLAEVGVDPGKVHLEITESMLLTSEDAVVDTLKGLKALGLELHIDDFGTGYSSLSYLQRFPADTLKIDRSFIDQLTQSEASAKLVQTIVAMAHTLDMRVVAEGVETPYQLARLRALSCEYFQGYYFSQPVTADAAGQLLNGPFEEPQLAVAAAHPSARGLSTYSGSKSD